MAPRQRDVNAENGSREGYDLWRKFVEHNFRCALIRKFYAATVVRVNSMLRTRKLGEKIQEACYEIMVCYP